ncbi:MAG: DUF3592 domain-containing protein [bacterium]
MALLKHYVKNLVKIVFSIIFIFHGTFFIYIERSTVNRTQAARAWPRTSGVIKELEYFGDDSYKIEYSYVVDGQKYSNDKIIPRFAWFSALNWREGGLEGTLIDSEGKSHFPKYVKENETTVFYNPTDPGDSLLLPFAPSMFLYRYYGIFSPLFLFFVSIIGFRKLKNNKNI